MKASDNAIGGGVKHLLLVVNNTGELIIKGTPSVVDSLSSKKKLFNALKSSICETKKGKQYMFVLSYTETQSYTYREDISLKC